jgi:hypothetical protein
MGGRVKNDKIRSLIKKIKYDTKKQKGGRKKCVVEKIVKL